MADQQGQAIMALLQETRKFPPTEEFRRQAVVQDSSLHEEARRDLEGFWSRFAGELHWFRRWDRVLDWNPPWAKWFVGGKTNVAYNCLDRHLSTPRRNKAAIVWEGEQGEERAVS